MAEPRLAAAASAQLPDRHARRALRVRRAGVHRPRALPDVAGARHGARDAGSAALAQTPLMPAKAGIQFLALGSPLSRDERLESEEVCEQVFLLGRRQRRSEDVPGIAVSRETRVVTEALFRRLVRIAIRRDEAAVLAVDNIAAAHESLRALV